MNYKDCIYIITKAHDKDCIKIGYSADLGNTLESLNKGQLRNLYEVYAVYESDNKEVEKVVKDFDDLMQTTCNKSPEQAYNFLSDIAELTGTKDKLHKISKGLFKIGDDFYEVSATDALIKHCEHCISAYGFSAFKQGVLGMKLSAKSTRVIFTDNKSNLPVNQTCHYIPQGLYILTNFSTEDIERIHEKLINLFPLVYYRKVS